MGSLENEFNCMYSPRREPQRAKKKTKEIIMSLYY